MSISFLFFALFICHAVGTETSNDKDYRKELYDWIRKQPDFYLNPKVEFSNDKTSIARAKEQIEPFEELIVIPSSAILYSKSYLNNQEDDVDLCDLFELLWEQIELGEDSNFEPYLLLLQEEYKKPPALWSTIGQRLLGMMEESQSYYRTDSESSWKSNSKSVLDWIDDYEECFENDASEESVIDAKYDVLAMAAQHHVDQLMFIPFYDQLYHHSTKRNVKHILQDDGSVSVVSLTSIAPGSVLCRQTQACIDEDCDESVANTAINLFGIFGYIPDYPHYWMFPFDVSFYYDGRGPADKEGVNSPTIKWEQRAMEDWQLDFLIDERNRQTELFNNEILKSEATVPHDEWLQVVDLNVDFYNALAEIIEESFDYFNSDHYDEDENEPNSETVEDVGDQQCKADVDHLWKVPKNIFGMFMRFLNKENNDFSSIDDHTPTPNPWAVKGCHPSNCSHYDLYEGRGCNDYNRSIHYKTIDYAVAVGAYIATVGPNRSSIGSIDYESGMKVPFKVDHSPGRGRGLFATEEVAEGTVIWESRNTALFYKEEQFVKFAACLPDALVCDLLQWCYTSFYKPAAVPESVGHGPWLSCDLDEGALLNTADTEDEKNVYFDMTETGELLKLYALRRITTGEEFGAYANISISLMYISFYPNVLLSFPNI